LSKRSEDVKDLKETAVHRDAIRMGIPSKGRMAEDTLALLASCQLRCQKPNPRQYFGEISAFPGMEVWFQRASDVVRKLRTGDIDVGIVGMDMFAEFAEEDSDLVVIHDALDFGQCKLALGVPTVGTYADVDTLEQLKGMGWSETQPLRVVTGYTNIARRCAPLPAYLP
jgi:ATP phosphoribosyltransferase